MAMAHVAAGRADCYAEFGVHVWDIAAGCLLMWEAGGVVVNTDGRHAFVSRLFFASVIFFRLCERKFSGILFCCVAQKNFAASQCPDHMTEFFSWG